MSLVLRDLELKYGIAESPVISGLSLVVPNGGFISIVGASGSGKSSILNMISGLVAPTSGTILINDKTPSIARADCQVGFVFQQPILFEWRNVLRNVQLPGEILRNSEITKGATKFINLVGLEGFEHLYPHELSGGMQSRVALARALAPHPRLLLMDEPFADLDELTREKMNLELLRIWAETSTTIVFVTHSLEEAVFLSDAVYVLGCRPATIVETVVVDLSRPRTSDMIDDVHFQALVTRARKALRDHSEVKLAINRS